MNFEIRPGVNLFHCDCMDLMRETPDKFYDLCIVDPPYGINVAKMAYTQEENRPCRQKNGSVLRVKKLKYRHGDWDRMPPADEYFDELIRVSREQIIWGVDHYNYSFPHNGRIKWNKHTPDGVSFNTYEYAYCSLINGEVLFDYLWAGMCQAKSLKEPLIQQGNKRLNEKRIHPCHKPINLYKWLLKTYATPDMKIIDTHLGSGSSAIAAYDFGCDFVGCEIDKEYFDAAVKRFNTHKLQGTLSFG
jgi:site-specific DNA-methyltransferase (adenine-specific)